MFAVVGAICWDSAGRGWARFESTPLPADPNGEAVAATVDRSGHYSLVSFGHARYSSLLNRALGRIVA